MNEWKRVGTLALSVALLSCGSAGQSGADASAEAADAGSRADAGGDASPSLDAGISGVQLGGWRMRGRDRQRSHQIPLGPQTQADAAAPFLVLEDEAFISDVVLDAMGNLYLGVHVSQAGASTDAVRSYTPSGMLRWESPLADFPRQLALGDDDQVYAIITDATATSSRVVALASDGAPLWSVNQNGAQDLAIADGGDILLSLRDPEDAYAIVRLRDDGSERWRLDEGGKAFALDGEDNLIVVLNTAGETSLIKPASAIASFDSEGAERWRLPLEDNQHDGALLVTEDNQALAATKIVSEGGVSLATSLTRLSSTGTPAYQVEVENFLPLDALIAADTTVVVPGHTSVGLNPTSRARSIGTGAAVSGQLSLCHQALLGDEAGTVYSSCNGQAIRAAQADGTIVTSWQAPDTHQIVGADDGTIYLVPALFSRRNELLRIAP